jgi:hypothetical protein
MEATAISTRFFPPPGIGPSIATIWWKRNAAARHLTHQLKSPEFPPLLVAVAHQGLDKRRIFAVAQGFRVEAEIDIDRADMGHVLIPQQQPRHRAADHGELALKAAEDLTDLHENRLHRGGCPVVVVGGRLRLGGNYRRHVSFSCRR